MTMRNYLKVSNHWDCGEPTEDRAQPMCFPALYPTPLLQDFHLSSFMTSVYLSCLPRHLYVHRHLEPELRLGHCWDDLSPQWVRLEYKLVILSLSYSGRETNWECEAGNMWLGLTNNLLVLKTNGTQCSCIMGLHIPGGGEGGGDSNMKFIFKFYAISCWAEDV